MLKDRLRAISSAFVTSRLKAQALPEFPEALPGTLEEAYAIQDISVANWPTEVAGWKIGGIPEHFARQYGDAMLIGPIFRGNIVEAGEEPVPMPVFSGGFAAAEPELVFEIAQDIAPDRRNRTREQLVALVARCSVGVEMASSPLATINALGPASIVSDFGNNAGLVVGDPIEDWANEGRSLTCSIRIDGQPIAEKHLASMAADALRFFSFLLDKCADRGIALARGCLITTGAITGVHDVSDDSYVEVDFGTYGLIRIRTTPAIPQ